MESICSYFIEKCERLGLLVTTLSQALQHGQNVYDDSFSSTLYLCV